MPDKESDHDKLIRIEEHIQAIKARLDNHPPLRHVNKDGDCDAYRTVITHDRRLNQWIGFAAAISIVFSIIGGAIVAFISWLRG